MSLYRLARRQFRMDSAAAAVRTYLEGADQALTEPAAALYRQDLRWIASPAELAKFDSLEPPERGAWLRLLWSRRDVAGGEPPGGRLVEHYRRYEYALRNFPLRVGSRAEAGQVVTAETGTAAQVATGTASAAGDATLEKGTTLEALEPAPASEAAWAGGWEAAIGAGNRFREYKPWQALVDDRGTIYIRHGRPDEMAFFVGGPGTPANLTWLYHRPDGDMVFHFMEADFDGSSGATTLVANLPRYMLASRCGLDARLCMLSTQRGAMPPEVMVRERDRAREAIRKGTTSDHFARTFKADLGAVLQVYGLHGSPESGSGRILVVFAVPAGKLGPAALDSTSGRKFHPLQVQVMALDTVTGARFDSDAMRRFQGSRDLAPAEYLSAFTELEVPAGGYLVTVVVSQGQDERGTGATLGGIGVPSSGAALDVSDVILGRPGAGLSWRGDGMNVPLNPLNAFEPGDVAEVYYSASGLRQGERYDVRISVARAGSKDKPVISLIFDDRAGASSQAFQRSIDLEKLKPGAYLLVVSVRSQETGETVQRSTTLNVVRGARHQALPARP